MGRHSIDYLSKLKHMSNEDQNYIIDSFLSFTKSIKQLAEELSIPASSISSFLKWKGIDTKEHIRNRYDSIAKSAVEDHMSGMLMKDVVAKYNISSDIIYHYMHKNHIVYSNNHGRKNWFNQQFFHEVDSESKAYFLGFLFADGWIGGVDKNYTRPCNIILDLSSKDRCILEKFLECIEASGSTHIRDYISSDKTYKAGPMSIVSLTSTVMADDLTYLGFSGLKRDRSKVPNIDSTMIRHFVRGYFDGDGCATSNSIQITGQIKLLENLSSMIQSQLKDIHPTITAYYENKTVGDLLYNRKQDRSDLFHWLYDDSSLYLQRKKDAFIKVL